MRGPSTRDPKQAKLYRWGMSAAAGGFVFGFHAAVVSGALLSISDDFRLTPFQQGALVGLLPLGAMGGSLLAGRVADGFGRRRTLVLDACVVLAGAALAAAAPDYGVLLAARAIVGLGVGIASSIVPLYLSEIAPAGVRGRLVTLNQLFVTLGILTAYVVDLIFAGSGSWRAMFAVGLVPPAALLLGMLRSPETPAWLGAHARPEEARQVVLEVVDEAEADSLLESLGHSRRLGGRRADIAALLRSPARPALIVGVALAALQQLCGINAIIYYAPHIMERTGLSAVASILSSVILGVINVAATVVSFRLVDRAGRRPLLLASLGGMFISLVLLGVALMLPPGSAGSLLALVCILVYVAAFAVGLGPIYWLLVSEIFPTDARAAGAGISTAVNWLSNFIVGLIFLPVVSAMGQGPTFWIFAAVCALAFAFVTRFVPETRNRSFVDIDNELRERWPAAA
jgi:sugar porter (SP) family MFS transporter